MKRRQPVYMVLVSPLLKWVIYPSMMKGIRRRWEKAFPVTSSDQRIIAAVRSQPGER